MMGYRNPGRREMAKKLGGVQCRTNIHVMRGNVPRELEQDREFYLLFQESKRLEAKLPATQDAFNACINQLRARAMDLLPWTRPS